MARATFRIGLSLKVIIGFGDMHMILDFKGFPFYPSVAVSENLCSRILVYPCDVDPVCKARIMGKSHNHQIFSKN